MYVEVWLKICYETPLTLELQEGLKEGKEI